MSKWSDIPEDLLIMVVEKLDNLCHYIRFCGVCSSWRSAAKQDSHRLRHQLPVLISSSGLFLPITNIPSLDVHHQQQQQLPALSLPQKGLCRGSYKGWLVMVNRDKSVHVQNPVTGQNIELPPLTTLPDLRRSHYPEGSNWSVRKIVLSSEPVAENCFVLVIHDGGDLAYCKLGDTTWSPLTVESPNLVMDETWFGVVDAIHYMGQFLVLHDNGNIFACKLSSSRRRLTEFDFRGPYTWDKSYLAQCGSELLLITRNTEYAREVGYCHCGKYHNQTTKFGVYKQDGDTKQWIGVKDLGDYALLLGFNQSFSVPASVVHGVKRNHIYFTDDHEYIRFGFGNFKCTGRDMGIFDLKESKIKQLCPINALPDGCKQTPVWWVIPNQFKG